MPRLVKRSPVTPPKPLPQRGKENEETSETSGTTLCKFEDKPPEKSDPILGWCKNCTRNAAHSWIDKLCYRCHKEANGFVFDDETKRWTKKPERKRK